MTNNNEDLILWFNELREYVMKAEPSEDYDLLKKQFFAMRSLINTMSQEIYFYSKKSYETGEKNLANLKEQLESERDMNSQLTKELEAQSIIPHGPKLVGKK